MRVWKKVLLGVIGGAAYVAVELLWRGRSHWSMFLVGGLCFVLIGKMNLVKDPWPLWARLILGSLTITAAELGTGILLNLVWGMQVWNYTDMPYQFMGQICLPYTLLWIPMAWFAGTVYERLFYKLLSKPSDT